MWIEIPDEIEEYLSNVNNPMSKSALAINTLLESMLKGQHIVYVSRKLLSKIESLDYINPSNKMFISWIKQKYVYIYSCQEIVKYKIKVTVEDNEIKINGMTYIVPLEYFYDFRESKLLTENEADGRFYLYLYNFIKKEEKVGDMYSVKFENDSCHGGNVKSKLLQNADENRIAICILDSDREMNGTRSGSTYKGANDAYKKIKNNHIILLKALESREKENLLPPRVYIPFDTRKEKMLEILHKFIEEKNIIRFFDIKEGIKHKKYKIKGWEKYYKEIINEFIKAGIYKIQDEENEIVDDEFVHLEGIGDKVNEIACKILFTDQKSAEQEMKKYNLSPQSVKEIEKMRNSFKGYLPQYMYEEWKDIYSTLFSWGCRISANQLPYYEYK